MKSLKDQWKKTTTLNNNGRRINDEIVDIISIKWTKNKYSDIKKEYEK